MLSRVAKKVLVPLPGAKLPAGVILSIYCNNRAKTTRKVFVPSDMHHPIVSGMADIGKGCMHGRIWEPMPAKSSSASAPCTRDAGGPVFAPGDSWVAGCSVGIVHLGAAAM